jgi:23S rRNA maturation mini-RNase III
MSDKEAGDYLEEIEVQVSKLFKYHKKVEKMNAKDKANILAQAPAELLEKWNIEKRHGNILTERSKRNMNL